VDLIRTGISEEHSLPDCNLLNHNVVVGLEVFTAVIMKNAVF
jgi:hypothetical protein